MTIDIRVKMLYRDLDKIERTDFKIWVTSRLGIKGEEGQGPLVTGGKTKTLELMKSIEYLLNHIRILSYDQSVFSSFGQCTLLCVLRTPTIRFTLFGHVKNFF